MQPEIRPPINGGRVVNPLITKLRRKLGLTYIVDNPFRVPVAQSAIGMEGDDAKRAKKQSI